MMELATKNDYFVFRNGTPNELFTFQLCCQVVNNNYGIGSHALLHKSFWKQLIYELQLRDCHGIIRVPKKKAP